MIFQPDVFCLFLELLDLQYASPHTLDSSGLWIMLVSSGACTVYGHPQMASAGGLIIANGPLRLLPTQPCHLLGVRLDGLACQQVEEHLSAPLVAAGTSCPAAAELLMQLHIQPPFIRSCELAYQLLCECATADRAADHLPPLVVACISLMREHYPELYGVEDLSDHLGVTKHHLVRVFHQCVGMTPGKYLTQVRLEAAKQLLCNQEYSLEVVASLCGFSGSNYLCRVFKKQTGQTPASWRKQAMSTPKAEQPLPREQELFV